MWPPLPLSTMPNAINRDIRQLVGDCHITG